MKLKIDLNYKLGNENITKQEATYNLVLMAINAKNPQGLQGQARRIFGRLQAKLDEAIIAKAKDIDIEMAELELITKSIDEASLPVAQASNYFLIEEAIAQTMKKAV